MLKMDKAIMNGFNKFHFTKTPAVVLGLGGNGLSIVRTLGRKGIPVLGVSGLKYNPGRFSKYINYGVAVKGAENDREKELVEILLELAKKIGVKAVLYSTSDEYVLVVSKYRSILSEYYYFKYPSHNLIEILLDKNRSGEIAEKHGLSCPCTYYFENEEELKCISEKIEYPCIIKPRYSHLWKQVYDEKKVFVINTRQGLIDTCKIVKDKGLDVFIQQIISPKDSSVYEFMAYFNDKSQPLATFCCKKIRQYPAYFGIGALSESIHDEILTNLSIRFLRDIEYKGIIHLEFKYDTKTKNPTFLEANARTSFINELAIASKVDLAYVAYQDLTSESGTAALSNTNYENGVKLINLSLDIGSYFQYKKISRLKLIDWIKSFKANKIAHEYFDLSDIKPFLKVYSEYVFYKLVHLIKGEYFKKSI